MVASLSSGHPALPLWAHSYLMHAAIVDTDALTVPAAARNWAGVQTYACVTGVPAVFLCGVITEAEAMGHLGPPRGVETNASVDIHACSENPCFFCRGKVPA
jgi:hypothetical protein